MSQKTQEPCKRSWGGHVSGAHFAVACLAALTAWAALGASPGNCLSFDGTNDYVQVADANSLDMTSNYTLECWFKADSFGGTGVLRGLISKYQSASANGYLLRLTGNDLDFDQKTTSGLNLQTGIWYHVAAVNSNGTRSLYLNGVSQSLSGTPLTVQANTNALRLASDYNDRYLAGQLDEVRIWNIARAAADIQNAMCEQLTGSETGLVAYYQFNQSSGTTLTDLTSNHLDGTLTNSPVWTASTAPLPFSTAQDGAWTTAATWAAGQGVPSNAWSRVLVQNAVTLGASQSAIDFSSTAAGSLSIGPGSVLTVTGSLNHLGVASGDTVLLSGAGSAYSLSGTFDYLQLTDPNGATLGADTTVNGNFTITSGNVNLNGKTLTLGSTARLAETGGSCFARAAQSPPRARSTRRATRTSPASASASPARRIWAAPPSRAGTPRIAGARARTAFNAGSTSVLPPTPASTPRLYSTTSMPS